jgi:hypothetical protein
MNKTGTYEWAKEQSKYNYVRHQNWPKHDRVTRIECTDGGFVIQHIFENGSSSIMSDWPTVFPCDGWVIYPEQNTIPTRGMETENLYTNLIRKLLKATQENKIVWEKYSSRKMIGTAFSKGDVVLEKTDIMTMSKYSLEIWNKEEELLDKIESNTLMQNKELENLFEMAWKKVTRFEDTLAAIEYDLDNL